MFKRALEWFGGSVLVYLVVAACAGADFDGNQGGAGGSNTNGGSATGMGTGGDASSMGATGAGASPSGAGSAPGNTGGTSIMNPVPDALAFPESGSRLKVRTISGSDGSANVIAGEFYDSQLEDVCSPSRAADGVTRCLPSGAASALFSDASCTTRLAYTTKGCVAPKYARWTESSETCAVTEAHVATVGSGLVPTELYSGTPEVCTNYAAVLQTYLNAYDFYFVGAQLPASSFVQITEGLL